MSIRASILRVLLRLCGFKFFLGVLFKKPPHRVFSFWPKWLSKKFPTDWIEMQHGKMATISPANSEPVGHVFYLHGGGYVLGFLPMFIRFANELVAKHNLRVSLVDYPLAPSADVDGIQQFVFESYCCLREKYPNDIFHLCGDSAGGALSMVLLQRLKASNQLMPSKTLLISPWVDANMARDFTPWDRLDVLLHRPSLTVAMDHYRKGRDLSDASLSPIYGDLSEWGDVAVVAGGGELFYPDLCRLKRELNKVEGTSLLWFEGVGLWHDWLYFDIPEAHSTRQDIGRWLASS